MKKYYTLGELIVDFRKHRNMTQIDFAALLDVDVRTVIRWEKNESLIKTDKEKILIEALLIPHQVIRNLNSDSPIPVYFDFKRWLFSHSFLTSMVKSSLEFKTEIEFDTNRIIPLSDDKDIDFINYIQKNQKNNTPLKIDVIKTAARLLPELNLVIRDNSGFHGGHISILPLKYSSYEMLRDRRKNESQLDVNDLARHQSEAPPAFYFYSVYSNSLDNTYYMMNKILFYFKKRKFKDYIFAGISYQKLKVERFKEMGFKIIWEEPYENDLEHAATFIEGNFDEFLFGQSGKI